MFNLVLSSCFVFWVIYLCFKFAVSGCDRLITLQEVTERSFSWLLPLNSWVFSRDVCSKSCIFIVHLMKKSYLKKSSFFWSGGHSFVITSFSLFWCPYFIFAFSWKYVMPAFVIESNMFDRVRKNLFCCFTNKWWHNKDIYRGLSTFSFELAL